MSTYPPEEDCTHIDYFSTNLPTTMLYMNGVLQATIADATAQRESAQRFDEGICCLEYVLSRMLGTAKLDDEAIHALLQALGEIVMYGQIGTRPGWMRRTLEQMGKSS
jgi:hypothetical protein